MIRWCSFCQKFCGYKEPLENYDLTHGICQECKSTNFGKKKHEGVKNEEFIKLHAKFYSDLRTKAKDEDFDVKEVIKRAKSLKISISDLLIGMMQPMLYEIGSLYAQGKITVVQEHRFTHFVERVLAVIEIEYNIKPANEPLVLLVCADGNYHSLGIRLLGLILNQLSIATHCIFPSVPLHDLKTLIQQTKPKVVGISINATSQLTFVNDITQNFAQTPIKFVLGGNISLTPEQMQKTNVSYIAKHDNFFEIIEYFQKTLNSNLAA